MARRRNASQKGSVLQYRQLPSIELRQRIAQCRERGDIRTAIEMARECHRREPGREHAEVLGGLYVDRARQFIAKNLYAEALSVLSNSLALGYGNIELLRMMFECGLQGRQYGPAMSAFKSLQSTAEGSWASARLADEAVARGDALDGLCEAAVREDARRIRRAFAAFERGDDAGVKEELRPVGLSSLCAGWKWLLLGLVAHSRGEADRAATSWARVEGEGRAARLARVLESVLLNGETEAASGPSGLTPGLEAKVRGLFTNPRLILLQQIQDALGAGEPDKALDLCGRLLADIPVAEREAYARRLGRALCLTMVEERDTAHRFLRIFGRLPEDPKLIRTAALSTEGPDPEEAIDIWSYFLDTLNDVAAIPESLRGRTRGLVLRRMGDLAREIEEDDYYAGGPSASPVSYYRQSIACCPDDLQAHERLVEALLEQAETRQAQGAALEILKRWPAHVKSLLLLAAQCLERNAFQKALRYFERAREAEPFDDTVRDQMQFCYMMSARRRLDQNRLDLARMDYERAESLGTPGKAAHLYGKWAALEWRAGDAARAESLYERALASGEDRVYTHLLLVIELERAPAPEEVQERFRRILKERWRDKPTAAGAVEMVDLMLGLESLEIDHPGLDEHYRALAEYLRRAAGQVTFSEQQLLKVCAFLESSEEWGALETTARRGVECFADSYQFPLYLGRAQLGPGARKLPRKTKKLLHRASQKAMQDGNMEAAGEIGMMLAGFSSRGMGGLGILERLFALLDQAQPEDLPMPREEEPRPRRRRDQPTLFEDLYETTTKEP